MLCHTVPIRPEYQVGNRIFPCAELLLPVVCVSGRTETGLLVAALPLLGIRFYYHEARELKALVIRYAQQRQTFGKPIAQHQAIQIKLADMATRIEAARLLLQHAARKKDGGERCDLEAGMAKLFATEMCQEVTLEAMRIHGGYGYTKEFNVERYYRDAPFMLVAEGTSEIQKLVIARQLLEKYKL